MTLVSRILNQQWKGITMKIRLRARVKTLNVTDNGLILKLDPTERYEYDGKTVFAVTRLEGRNANATGDDVGKCVFGEALREVTYYKCGEPLQVVVCHEGGQTDENEKKCKKITGAAFANVIPSLTSREATFTLELDGNSLIVNEIEFHF